MVDEAKAFCPGCGNAFVEETKRETASEFDRLDSTVRLGQTMYNQMLSDMGLNISKAPNTPEKRIEVVVPAAVPVPAKPPEKPAAVQVRPSYVKWLVIAGIILILGFFVVAAAGVLFYYFGPRFN